MQASIPPKTCSGGVCAPTSVTAVGAEDTGQRTGQMQGTDTGDD